jgi:hypothetical protein
LSIETDFLRLITEATVPGIAAAIIRDGRLDRYVCRGVRSAQGAAVVDENTVFEAASLTKPVFAHMVLQLVDQGYLSLDAPLGDYLPNYVPGDDRASTITPRQVLSYAPGLPNWRNAEWPLKTHFPPGDRFSYSGEGFLYLQKAVEATTGKQAPVLVEQLVLEPFAMTQSSLIWDSRFDVNRAYPHDDFGRAALSFKPAEANAAWSLQTTAIDFGRFLLAVLDGSRLKPESAELWLRPQIEIKHQGAECLGPRDGDMATGVAGDSVRVWSWARAPSSIGATSAGARRSRSARSRTATRSSYSPTVHQASRLCPNCLRTSCLAIDPLWRGWITRGTMRRRPACCERRARTGSRRSGKRWKNNCSIRTICGGSLKAWARPGARRIASGFLPGSNSVRRRVAARRRIVDPPLCPLATTD